MIISRTPLRISLFGGGSDLPSFYRTHHGAALSFTIDKYVNIIVNRRLDNKIIVEWSQEREVVDSVNQVKHDLVREALKFTETTGGIEVHTISDITSAGSGLGSSSAVTVGLLKALDPSLYASDLADGAVDIELKRIGKPIGIQDQWAAAHGGFNLFEFRADRSHTIAFLRLAPFCANLLLFATNLTRKADDILKQINVGIQVETLATMANMAREAAILLEKQRFDEVGRMLHTAWKMKKSLAGAITNPTIDSMYETARDAGALGGKICGAGGGGYLLLYAPPQQHQAIRTALADYQELPFNYEPKGSRIIYADVPR